MIAFIVRFSLAVVLLWIGGAAVSLARMMTPAS